MKYVHLYELKPFNLFKILKICGEFLKLKKKYIT